MPSVVRTSRHLLIREVTMTWPLDLPNAMPTWLAADFWATQQPFNGKLYSLDLGNLARFRREYMQAKIAARTQAAHGCACDDSPLCRHHHKCQQNDGWTLEQPEPGVLKWRTPAGRTYTTTPTSYPL
jgi:hypothetical protein